MCTQIFMSSGSFTTGKHEVLVREYAPGLYDLMITLSVNDEYLCSSKIVTQLSAKEVAMAVELLQKLFDGQCL